MEAVGAAAAIAELSGLSIRASKAAKNLMQSFVHAPAQITELNDKIERLHLLIQQIALLCAELPADGSNMLFPPQHRALISLSLQRTLDSLVGLKSSGQIPDEYGVRGRIRWAAMDKRKAQSFLQSIQVAEAELDFPLQVLTIRLATLNQNSIAVVASQQALLQETLLESVEEIKVWISQEVSRFQKPVTQSRDSMKAISTRASNDEGLADSREEQHDPVQWLMEHDMRRTLSYHEATLGNASRDVIFEDGRYSVGAAAVLRRKSNSTNIKFLLSLGCKLFGATVLKAELHISIKCRSWRLEPHIASSITALNQRPSHSPIFVACRRFDLNTVRYLLHTGEASIYDVDEDVGGLLEHVIFGKRYDILKMQNGTDFHLGKGQRLLEYLLDKGCDAGLYLQGRESKRPAVLLAFELGYTTAVTSMMSHGADINDFGSQPAALLGEEPPGYSGRKSGRLAGLMRKIGLLQSLGYSDWQTCETVNNNLLYAACRHRQMNLVCFALKVAGIDPNLTGKGLTAPICNAAGEAWLEGVAVLITAGARVNISNKSIMGTPLIRSIHHDCQLYDTGHFLLLQGANPKMSKSRGLSAWGTLWTQRKLLDSMLGLESISFIHVGNSSAHLLHHGADPFEVFTTSDEVNSLGFRHASSWFDNIRYVRASDVSVLFSQGFQEREQSEAIGRYLVFNTKQSLLQLRRNDPKSYCWDHTGNIHRVCDGMYAEDTDSYAPESKYSGETKLSTIKPSGRVDYSLPSNTVSKRVNSSGWNEVTADSHEYSGEEDTSNGSAKSVHNVEDQELLSTFNTTRFYHHIANEQGRWQLSRFPLARALCDALQHSGFRAEMDDDGDIWYDCDDGDRYFDAWEYHDGDQDDEIWLPRACPICKDFQGYGLGDILETAKRGRAEYYEYRDKVQQGKVSLCL